jgi:hypothetical protein
MNFGRFSVTRRSFLLKLKPSLSRRQKDNEDVVDSSINAWIRSTRAIIVEWQVPVSEAAANEHFPLAHLKLATDDLLAPKEGLDLSQCSDFLSTIIEQHTEKDTALLACGHRLSRALVRKIIINDIPAYPDTIKYLRIILAIRHINFDSIDDIEARWAECLLSLCISDTTEIGDQLGRQVALLSSEPPRSLLLRSMTDFIPRQAAFQLSSQLSIWNQEGDFASAYVNCYWLSRLHQTSNLTVILDEAFPDWHTWAFWRPDPARMEIWHGLTTTQRQRCKAILVLEGPDFITRSMKTLREGLNLSRIGSEIHAGTIIIKVTDGRLLDHLRLLNIVLDTFDAAVSTPNGVSFLIQLCIDRPVAFGDLELLEAARETGSITVHIGLLQILSNQEAPSVQLAAVPQILASLNGPEPHIRDIRQVLSPILVDTVKLGLAPLQANLNKQLQTGRDADALGLKITELLHSIKDSAWLHHRLNLQLILSPRNLPPLDFMQALFKVLAIARSTTADRRSLFIEVLSDYCITYLVRCGVPDSETELFVTEIVRFWIKPSTRKAREAALALAQHNSIPLRVRATCLTKLHDAPEKLLDAIRGLKGTTVTSLQFTRVLLSPKTYGTGLPECWQQMLQVLMEDQAPTILDNIFDHISLDDWFRWQTDLAKVFDSGALLADSQHQLFQQNVIRWSERLSKLLPAIKKIETVCGHGAVLQWIILGHEDSHSIFPLLHQLNSLEGSGLDPIVNVVLSKLKVGNDSASLIHDALSRISHLTDDGVKACLDVVNTYNREPITLPVGYVGRLLEMEDLLPADERALNTIVQVLDVRFNCNICH